MFVNEFREMDRCNESGRVDYDEIRIVVLVDRSGVDGDGREATFPPASIIVAVGER